jgi:hypothetical protein
MQYLRFIGVTVATFLTFIFRSQQAKFLRWILFIQLAQTCAISSLSIYEYVSISANIEHLSDTYRALCWGSPSLQLPSIRNGSCFQVSYDCYEMSSYRPVYIIGTVITFGVCIIALGIAQTIFTSYEQQTGNSYDDDIEVELMSRQVTLTITLCSYLNDLPLFAISIHRLVKWSSEYEYQFTDDPEGEFAFLIVSLILGASGVFEAVLQSVHCRDLIWYDYSLRTSLSLIIIGVFSFFPFLLKNLC